MNYGINYGIYQITMSDNRKIKVNAGNAQVAIDTVLSSVCKGAPVSAVKSCKLIKLIKVVQ